jgi:hypothetical protein
LSVGSHSRAITALNKAGMCKTDRCLEAKISIIHSESYLIHISCQQAPIFRHTVPNAVELADVRILPRTGPWLFVHLLQLYGSVHTTVLRKLGS